MNSYEKDMQAFIIGEGYCIWQPGQPTGYTRSDIIRLAQGDESLARVIFDRCAEQSPEDLAAHLIMHYRPEHRDSLTAIDASRLSFLSAGGRQKKTDGTKPPAASTLRQLTGIAREHAGYVALLDARPGVLFYFEFKAIARSDRSHSAYEILEEMTRKIAQHTSQISRKCERASVFLNIGAPLPEKVIRICAFVAATDCEAPWVQELAQDLMMLELPPQMATRHH